MPASADTVIAAADDPPPRPPRVLLRALLWVVLAHIAAFAVAFLIAIVAGFHDALAGRHGGVDWNLSPASYALPATAALQAGLLYAAVRQGLLSGHGSLPAGLGAGPVRRRGLVALFVALIIGWLAVYLAVLAHLPRLAAWLASDVPAALALPASPGILLLIVRVLLIAVLAPLAEELFFRGWLWTALRRSWGAWPTALCTGGFWLALHALTGPARVPILVPAAILLSLARHYGGSVRASLPVHIANNGSAVAIQLLALATRAS